MQRPRADGDGTIGEAKRRQEGQRAISAAKVALASPLGIDGIAEAIHNALVHVITAPIWLLGLYDRAAQSVEVVWQLHNGVEIPGGSFPLGNGFTSRVIRSGRPLLIHYWTNEGPPVQVQYATDRSGLPESSITAPILFGAEVLGVVSVQDYRPNVFDEYDLTLLQAIANEAAYALSALQRQALDTHAISAETSDAVLIVDGQGRLVRLNGAARQFLCTKGSSIILGQPLDSRSVGSAAVAEPRLAETLRTMVEWLKKGETPTAVKVVIGDHTQHTISVRGRPLRRRDGEPAGGVIILNEIAGAHRGR